MIEKRRFVRVDVPIRVQYRGEGKKLGKGEAISKNIGGMGICVHVSRRFLAGSLLNLTLRIPGTFEDINAEAKVIWIGKSAKDGGFPTGYEAGLRFTSISKIAKASIINFICESVERRKESKISSQEPSS